MENSSQPSNHSEIDFHERLIAEIPGDVRLIQGREEPPAVAFGPTGAVAAVRVRKGRRQAVFDGCRTGPWCDYVGEIRFLPDGRRPYYWAMDEKKQFVVQGEEPGERFDSASTPLLLPAAGLVVYSGRLGAKEHIVLGVAKSKAFDWVGSRHLGLKSSVAAHEVNVGGAWDSAGRKFGGGRWHVVTNDGREFGPFESVGGVTVSEDGRRIGFYVVEGKRRFVMIDGVKGPDFDDVGMPFFSDDGSVWAHDAKRGNRRFAVVNGVEGPEFDYVGQPSLSADGRSVAFSAHEGPEQFVVFNGRRGPSFDETWRPSVRPRGGMVAYGAQRQDKWMLVVNESVGVPFDNVYWPAVFSPKGDGVAYGASNGGRQFVVVGEVKGPWFDQVRDPVFSPDGSTIAYAAKVGKKECVVLGGRLSSLFDMVSDPVFSPDGLKVAFGARSGRQLWWKVLSRCPTSTAWPLGIW